MAESKGILRTAQSCPIRNQTIRGTLLRPDTEGRLPLVICSHGYGSPRASVEPYAEALAAKGMAAYSYDFRGGSMTGESDGATTDMSVMTEVADLEAVLQAAAGWPFVDTSRIVLLGASQGGYVSAVAAARRVQETAALVLLYPAFVAGDDMHRNFASLADVPEKFIYRNTMELGKRYFEDLWDYDPYAEIGKYTGPVLIIHGTADPVVPLSYSERARDVYRDAVLETVPDAGHGFHDADFDRACADIVRFLKAHGFIAGGQE